MSHLGRLIETYQRKHGTSDRAFGRLVGVSHTMIGKWKRGHYKHIPGERLLRSLADQMSLPLTVVIDAALKDTVYQDAERGDGDDGADRAAPIAT